MELIKKINLIRYHLKKLQMRWTTLIKKLAKINIKVININKAKLNIIIIKIVNKTAPI